MQTTNVKLGPFSKATHPLKIATLLQPCKHCIKNGLNYSSSSMLPWRYQFLTCLVISSFCRFIHNPERNLPHRKIIPSLPLPHLHSKYLSCKSVMEHILDSLLRSTWKSHSNCHELPDEYVHLQQRRSIEAKSSLQDSVGDIWLVECHFHYASDGGICFGFEVS